MSLEELTSYNWSIMTPEFIIVGVAALLTVLDLFMPKKQDRRILGWIGIMAIFAAIVSVAGLLGAAPDSILEDTFRLDSFGKAFKLLLLAGGALVLFLAVSYKAD
jgi:NADH-quinone oxidoreductase subunit N